MGTGRFPFVSRNTFLAAPAQDDARPLAVAGIPYDGAVTNRPGARFGPDAIRRASHMLCDGIHPHFDVSPLAHLTDLGDLDLPHTQHAAMQAAVTAAASTAIAGHHVCWLGGDHSVTLPLLRAYRAHYGKPVALVHFDAHCDTWTEHFGEPSGHGTWLHEAFEEQLVLPSATVQLGIRSSGERSARERVAAEGGRIVTARELRGRDGAAALSDVTGEIRRRVAAAGNPPVYLTLDIDCLDPAFAPGTGTPEPGGLASSQVLTVLEELADLPWCGMDLVEVAPAYDHAELTSLAGATFVWTYLAARAARLR